MTSGPASAADLIAELIPNNPGIGLFRAPEIPPDRLQNAILDYGHGMRPDEVEALYDATLFESGKDGALFANDRFVFQNSDLESPRTIRYDDIVGVSTRRRFLSGRKVYLEVNQGRATFQVTIDFSGKPKAAQYVTNFLHEVMLLEPDEGARGGAETDAHEVIAALDTLMAAGKLSLRDYERLVDTLEEGA